MTTETTTDKPAGAPDGSPGNTASSKGDATRYDGFGAPLCRTHDGRILGGVAAGLARHFDLDVSIIRIAIVVLAVLGGTGVPLYLAGWLLIPEEGTGRSVLGDLLHPQAAG